MNRLVKILFKNLGKFPSAYYKLCKYAKHPERYTRQQMWEHIQYIMSSAVASSGNLPKAALCFFSTGISVL